MSFIGNKMDKSFLIYDALRAAFGYVGLPMFPKVTPDFQNAESFDAVDNPTHSSVSGADLVKDLGNGLFYLCPVKFTKEGQAEPYIVPYAMVACRASKKLVETPMVEAGGEVIEEIGINNHQFTIRGVILSEIDEVPVNDIKTLCDWFKEKSEVKMINAISDILMDDDDTIIIKDLSLPDMEGISYAQAFEIQAISNKPFNLYL